MATTWCAFVMRVDLLVKAGRDLDYHSAFGDNQRFWHFPSPHASNGQD
jgi:hypothetical protein